VLIPLCYTYPVFLLRQLTDCDIFHLYVVQSRNLLLSRAKRRQRASERVTGGSVLRSTRYTSTRRAALFGLQACWRLLESSETHRNLLRRRVMQYRRHHRGTTPRHGLLRLFLCSPYQNQNDKADRANDRIPHQHENENVPRSDPTVTD